MKIVICNVPLRSESSKTTYPPLGALAVIQSLRAAGYDAIFYDINVFRYPKEDIKNYFIKNKFDIVGISATVSTSYKFVKKIASIIKANSPNTIIVAGGALTASSEILLKFTNVDFCVIGEGEKTIVNLVNYISNHGIQKQEDELKKIKGICFQNGKGNVVFTGYEQQISVDEIKDADYDIIERHSKIDNYIIDPFYYKQFKHDPRSFEEHRKGKKLATVVTSRGCVNRCTFCHRWQKGIRIFPVDRVIKHIQHLQKNYNVGFISFGDEDFGASKKWIEEFIEKIEPLDILYRISAICIDNVDLPLLKKLKDSGCVAIHYGFESGSNKILKVMEKRADVERNEKVAVWTHQAGLQTVYALVIGMPGESYDTIRETTDFIKRITKFLSLEQLIVSINVLVVLPGAPVYEYARYKGLLGKTLKDEERYLSRVSNQSGGSLRQLNLTNYPYFIVKGWDRYICWTAYYHYNKAHNLSRLSTSKLFCETLRTLFKRKKMDKTIRESLYGNTIFYRLRYITAPLVVMYKSYKDDKRLFIKRCTELLRWPLKATFRRDKFARYISVRTLLKENESFTKKEHIYSPALLRLGR